MGKPLVRPRSGQFIKPTSSTTTLVVADSSGVEALTKQVTALQSQLAVAEAQLAQAQAQVVLLQGQVTQDALTISGLESQLLSAQSQVSVLQAEVTSLEAQIAALQAPNYFRLFLGSVTLVGGGVYVPPSYDAVTVQVTSLSIATRKPKLGSITTLGGGYP